MTVAMTYAAGGVLACGAAAACAAAFVWSRRRGPEGAALAALFAAVAVWNLCYGAELLAPDPGWRLGLGDLKYVGISALPPVWLLVILCWTGHQDRITRRLLLLLAVEPVAVLLLLAVPVTHDLVRSLPEGAADPLTVEVATGPLFWVHLAYADLLLLPTTAVFVGSLLRRSRAYWLQAVVLAVAALLPWAANVLFAASVGPFGALDLTPVLFTLMAALLVWGLFSQGLLRLDPEARSVLVDRMTDGVVVLDAFGHVADANPAARSLLGDVVGHRAVDVLPGDVLDGSGEARLRRGGERVLEVTDVALPGRRRRPAGRLLVLRDVTERAGMEARLRDLVADSARVTAQLSLSLRPAALPPVRGLQLAAAFRPAGHGLEIGGDFYDVVAVGDEWAFTIGDVSGKGARAAAVTASARYTLRTVVLAGAQPAAALAQLHALVAPELEDETYVTAAHGRVRPRAGGATVVLALGGHPQPLLVRADGQVSAVGVPGTAIGLLDTAETTEVELDLGAGDALVLFTDGVSEARVGRELYGDGALAAALARGPRDSATALADAVLAGVLALPGMPGDDIAVLVLRVPDVARAPAPRAASGSGARSPC